MVGEKPVKNRISARLVCAIASVAFVISICAISLPTSIDEFKTEPEVRIGIIQKASSARLKFSGSYRIHKSGVAEPIRTGSGETIQAELYTVRLKQMPTRFRVSLGQFRSFEQAEFTLKSIGAKPGEAVIAQPKQWSIWHGPYVTLADAQQKLEELQAKGYMNTRIEPESSDIPVLTLYAPDGSLIHLGSEPVSFYPSDGKFIVNGREYRGNVEVALDAYGSFSVINRVKVEDYLFSVLPREMPALSHPEALKAQAIIARSYLLKNLHRHKIDGFNLCSTTDCQVYGGIGDEAPTAIDAVRQTRGMALSNAGQIVNALFHSTCGGRTAAYTDVWHGDDLPYLISVDDGTSMKDKDLSSRDKVKKFLELNSANCHSSKYFRWDKSYTHEQLLSLLKLTIPEFTNNPELKINELRSVSVLSYSKSGRAQQLRISTDKGDFIFDKDTIRWVLGSLKSTMFIIDSEGKGNSRRYDIKGAGWGHGLGLCQIGAMKIARDGVPYDKILGQYYPGSKIVKLWK